MTPSHLIATFGGTGHMRPMPGTWGSAAGLLSAWQLHAIGGAWLVILAIPVAYFVGVWATAREVERTGNHDPSHVVIDEVAGQWIALLPVLIGADHAGVNVLALWPGWVVAFIAFRAFDILKPGPIGWADRRADATGVMLDDVIAGVFAAVVVAVMGGLFHAVI
ncbi:phosphatidylglycerophosphatase [Oceanicola sp. 22II-s10i]|uniref:phosphatidylglycerophosphatase A family protein n=1 Tax=Oceanicola sp. 22II-s10i TaxID=1317116 RepID=UPI000B5224B3|nr:phosphatidylglycerophosphatase A [Oceanicola sp. 22II-s10i]OWU84876.1 phosphatidylglycerophosphatase [Oceanicola sp. 22II-s10i]